MHGILWKSYEVLPTTVYQLKSGMFYFTCSHKQKNTNITDIREHASVVLEKQN